MDTVNAMEDLRNKILHYEKTYEPMTEKAFAKIRIDTSTMEIQAHKISGHIESTILGYIGSLSLKPHTLYFSRVSIVILCFDRMF